jgi:hypothetical protein
MVRDFTLEHTPRLLPFENAVSALRMIDDQVSVRHICATPIRFVP